MPDGFWGPISTRNCQRYLHELMVGRWAIEGQINRAPLANDTAMEAYYGKPCDDRNLTKIDVSTLGIYFGKSSVRSIACHKRAAESLLGALTDIAASPWASILSTYAGCYNPRKMRGGTRYSKHAWGVAIDLNPDDNMLHQHWPTSATMPFGVMEIFAQWGWTAAGAFWSRDAMHFERTRPY